MYVTANMRLTTIIMCLTTGTYSMSLYLSILSTSNPPASNTWPPRKRKGHTICDSWRGTYMGDNFFALCNRDSVLVKPYLVCLQWIDFGLIYVYLHLVHACTSLVFKKLFCFVVYALMMAVV